MARTLTSLSLPQLRRRARSPHLSSPFSNSAPPRVSSFLSRSACRSASAVCLLFPCSSRSFATVAPASSVPPTAPTTPAPISAAASSAPHRRLALLGAPGVGKGTYARFIGPHYSLPFISTGDLVRAEIAKNSAVGELVKAATNAGQLLDDDLIFALLSARLSQPDCQRGFLLDGFPRRIAQAEQLAAAQFQPDLVINLVLRQDILVQKLSARRVCSGCGRNYNIADINDGEYVMPPLLPAVHGRCDHCGGALVQRSDDTVDVVRDRLRIYEQQTMPLVRWYQQRGRLCRFEVKRGIEDVPRLLQCIDQALTAQEEQQRQAAGED